MSMILLLLALIEISFNIGVVVVCLLLSIWIGYKLAMRWTDNELFILLPLRMSFVLLIAGIVVSYIAFFSVLKGSISFIIKCWRLFNPVDLYDTENSVSIVEIFVHIIFITVLGFLLYGLVSYALNKQVDRFKTIANWVSFKMFIPVVLVGFCFGSLVAIVGGSSAGVALAGVFFFGVSAFGCYVYYNGYLLNEESTPDLTDKHKFTARYYRVGLRNLDYIQDERREEKRMKEFREDMSKDRSKKSSGTTEFIEPVDKGVSLHENLVVIETTECVEMSESKPESDKYEDDSFGREVPLREFEEFLETIDYMGVVIEPMIDIDVKECVDSSSTTDEAMITMKKGSVEDINPIDRARSESGTHGFKSKIE